MSSHDLDTGEMRELYEESLVILSSRNRPSIRRTTIVAIGLTLSSLGLLAFHLHLAQSILAIVMGVVLIATIAWLNELDSDSSRLVMGILTPITGAGFAVAFFTLDSRPLFSIPVYAVITIGTGTFGILLLLIGNINSQSPTRVLRSLLVAALGPTIGLIIILTWDLRLIHGAIFGIRSSLTVALSPAPPGIDHFLGLLAFLFTAVRSVLLRLPIDLLTGDEHNEPYRHLRSRIVTTLNTGIIVTGIGAGILFLFGLRGDITGLILVLPQFVREGIILIASSQLLRVVILGLILISVILLGIGFILGKIRQMIIHHRYSTYLTAIGSVLGLLLVLTTISNRNLGNSVPVNIPPTLRSIVAVLSSTFGETVLLIGMLVLISYLPIAIISTYGLMLNAELLPKRATGAALSSASVLSAAILIGFESGPGIIVLIMVATSFMIWDSGEYAIGLSEELDRGSPSSSAETVHLTSSAIIGTVSISVSYGAWKSLDLVSPDSVAVSHVIALVLALVSILGFVTIIRR